MLVLVRDGERHPLIQAVFTVGSGSVNNLVAQGDAVRKIHFQITRTGDRYRLLGLNGTVTVNGADVAERELEAGDWMQVGTSRLEVHAAAPDPALAENPYEELLDGVIGLLENPDKRKAAEDVLALGVRLMAADGGFLFSVEDDGVALLHSIPEENDLYSHSAVQAALRSGETLIWSLSDAAGEISLQSVEQKNIHSLLVSPLRERMTGAVRGLLYLHRRRGGAAFAETQRKLFDRVSQLLGAVLSDSQGQVRRQRQLESLRPEGGAMLFAGPEMAQVATRAEAAARNPIPALIMGEAGAGKDLLARFIHNLSPRRTGPFVAVPRGAAVVEGFAAELFGAGNGPSGASKPGLWEQARGGTLLFEEAMDLPPALQGSICRALAVADGDPETSVRLLMATRADLEGEARAGRFRRELLEMLTRVRLELPPLRDRGSDVLALASRILEKACDAYHMNLATLTKAAEKALLKYPWPGNVRELENRLQRALLNSPSRILDAEALELPREEENSGLKTLKMVREEAENRAIQVALLKARGNLTLAASFLGIDRKVLRDVMERLGIQKEEFKNK